MAGLGAWDIGDDGIPKRLEADRSLLESKLEAWIEADPSILDGIVKWVSRQLILPDRSRLDLLGLSPEGTWVIAELKAGAPTADAVRQALHYFLEMDAMSNAELVARIRAQGLSDPTVDSQLTDVLATDDDEHERDYRILVAGVGDGSGAEAAASTLARYGLTIPVEVIGFHLFTTPTGHVLVKEVDDDAASEAPQQSSAWSLDQILERASRFGIADGFEKIRTELLNRGYRSRLKKYGLNFNLGTRSQVFWVQPRREGLHIGYCAWNFPDLFGISAEETESRFGSNWLTLDPEPALVQMGLWLDAVEALQHLDEGPNGLVAEVLP